MWWICAPRGLAVTVMSRHVAPHRCKWRGQDFFASQLGTGVEGLTDLFGCPCPRFHRCPHTSTPTTHHPRRTNARARTHTHTLRTGRTRTETARQRMAERARAWMEAIALTKLQHNHKTERGAISHRVARTHAQQRRRAPREGKAWTQGSIPPWTQGLIPSCVASPAK